MKNLKSIAYLVGSLMVVACSAGDSSAGAPSDPATTVAPLKQASAQAVTDAIALRDQLQSTSNGDASVVAPGHRLVKIAKIQQRAIEQLEVLMEQAIAEHNGTGGVAVRNTGGTGGGGTGGSGAGGSGAGGSGADNGGTGDGGEATTGDPDLDNLDDNLDNLDENLDQEDDDLNPDDQDGGTDDMTPDSGDMTNPTPAPASSMGGMGSMGGGMDAGAPPSDPCKCGNGGGGSGGKPSAKPGGKPGGGGGGKPSGGAGGGKPSGASGASGASLQKLLDKLMKMLEKGAASPGQAKAKSPKAGTQAQAIQADLTALYKLLNDPLFKKWQKFGGA